MPTNTIPPPPTTRAGAAAVAKGTVDPTDVPRVEDLANAAALTAKAVNALAGMDMFSLARDFPAAKDLPPAMHDLFTAAFGEKSTELSANVGAGLTALAGNTVQLSPEARTQRFDAAARALNAAGLLPDVTAAKASSGEGQPMLRVSTTVRRPTPSDDLATSVEREEMLLVLGDNVAKWMRANGFADIAPEGPARNYVWADYAN